MLTKKEKDYYEMKKKEYEDMCESIGILPDTFTAMALFLSINEMKPTVEKKYETQKKYTPTTEKGSESDKNKIKYYIEQNREYKQFVDSYLEHADKTLDDLFLPQIYYLIGQYKKYR